VPGIVARIKVEPLKTNLNPVVRGSVAAAGERAVQAIVPGIRFDLSNRDVTRFLKKFGGERIGDINASTQRRVARVLERGIEAGDATATIAADISDLFDDMSDGRAFNIARTEIGRASNFGALEGYSQAGVDQKEWLATQDAAVRETHEEADGQIVGIDEEFEVGGLTCQFPGDTGDPSEDVNCRCGVLPVINERRLRVRRFAFWRAQDRTRKAWETKFQKKLRAAFATQKTAVVAAVNAAGA